MEEKQEIHNGIRHTGVVLAVNGERVTVSIVAQSACASCHLKGACSASDTKEKVIEGVLAENLVVAVGDEVDVVISQSNGYIAVFLSYIVPVLLILASIITASKIGYSEVAGAICGLGIMALYFIVLYLLRKKIDKKLMIKVVPK